MNMCSIFSIELIKWNFQNSLKDSPQIKWKYDYEILKDFVILSDVVIRFEIAMKLLMQSYLF